MHIRLIPITLIYIPAIEARLMFLDPSHTAGMGLDRLVVGEFCPQTLPKMFARYLLDLRLKIAHQSL